MIKEEPWVDGIRSTHASFACLKYNPTNVANRSDWVVFSQCSQYTRNRFDNAPTLIAVPFCYYHEEYNTEEAFVDWAKQINAMGGHITYDGTGKFRSKAETRATPKQFNRTMWTLHNVRSTAKYAKFLKEDKWVHWILNSSSPWQNYYTMILLRFLNSRHYQRIVSVYYDILQEGIEPFDAIQLAQYSHSFTYNAYYGLFDTRSNAYKLKTLAEIESGLFNKPAAGYSINDFFQRGPVSWTLKIKRLISERKYKEAYEQLKR